MASIGSVVTKITANADGMTAGISKAQIILKGGLAKMQESVSRFGETFAGVLAGNFATDAIKKGFGFLSNVFTDGNEAILNMGKAARKAGVDIGGMQIVAEAMGGDTEKAAEAMLKLSENIGKAAVEGADEPFKKLGLDAMELSAMSADKRMMSIAEKLSAIQDPIARARIGTGLFADQWKEVSAVLYDGGKLLASTAENLDKFGAGFNESALQSAKDAEQAFKQVSYLWKGFTNQVGQAIAPIVAEVAKAFGSIADYGITFQGLRDKIVDVAEWIAKAGAFVRESFADPELITKAWDVVFQFIQAGLNDLKANLFDSISYFLPGKALEAEGLRGLADAQRNLGKAMGKKLGQELADLPSFKKVDEVFANVRDRIKDTKKDAQQFNPFELWAQSMDKLKDSLKTGFDTFREEAKRVVGLLDFARKAGKLTAADAAVGFQALGRSVQGLLSSLPQMKFAGAMELGSGEAYSATIAAQFDGKQSVQEAIAELNRRQLEEQQIQTELGKQTVDALRNLGFLERAIP